MRQVFAGNAAPGCRLNQVNPGGPVGIDDACASAPTGLQPSQRASSDLATASSRKLPLGASVKLV